METERPGAGDGADFLFPENHEIIGMNTAPGRIEQDNLHRTKIGSGPAHGLAQGLTDQGESFLYHGLSAFGRDARSHPHKGLFDPLQGRFGHCSRGAVRKFHG